MTQLLIVNGCLGLALVYLAWSKGSKLGRTRVRDGSAGSPCGGCTGCQQAVQTPCAVRGLLAEPRRKNSDN